MKITKAWVEKWKPCEKAVKLAAGHGFTLGSDDVEVAEFFAKRDFAWANWLITRRLRRADCVRYARYAANNCEAAADAAPAVAREASWAAWWAAKAAATDAALAVARAAFWAAYRAVDANSGLKPQILEYGIELMQARK